MKTYRRFQCTNREFLAFTFREIYDEVDCPDGFPRTHAESIFLVDNYGDVHEMWPNWIFNNFKEIPSDELVPDPYENDYTPDGHYVREDEGCLKGVLWAVVLTVIAVIASVIICRS